MEEFLFGNRGSPTRKEEMYDQFLADKIFFGRKLINSEETYGKVYKFIILRNHWRIKDVPGITKRLLGKRIREQKVLIGNFQTLIKNLNGRDLEKYLLDEFKKRG